MGYHLVRALLGHKRMLVVAPHNKSDKQWEHVWQNFGGGAGCAWVRLSVMNSEMPLICAKKSGHQGLNADFWEICPYHTIFRICVLRAGFTTLNDYINAIWKDTKEYLNHRGTKIRVFQVCFWAPFLPPFCPYSPLSFPFKPCSLSHHFSPLHLPLYPLFFDSRKSPI